MNPPDSHHLAAAIGWLELGDTTEAIAELDEISAENSTHPDALDVRFHIATAAGQWQEALATAEVMLAQAPDIPDGWIHRAQALRKMDRTREAFDALQPAAALFPAVWQVPYNLACYATQLGQLAEALQWFTKAVEVEPEAVRAVAVEDRDLEALFQ